jgi:dinuclear metal center YbgI/SA1388 family protein
VPRVADWIAALDSLYDPSWAADWDAVGLVAGDPDAECGEALFAVDPVGATVEEAVRRGVRLLVTHHPLLLRGVHGVPLTDYKGRLLDRLGRNGIALFVAHTNADSANPGVSDALARALGLTGVAPLVPDPPDEGTKLVANDIVPTLLPHDRGAGRVGDVEPATLAEFADVVRAALPTTGNPVRVAGEADRPVRRVAVCGGAGDDLIDAARAAGADVYVTADLRHHPVSEARERGLALVDAGHWASEWPWLGDAAERVAHRVGGVRAYVSTIVTDPWSLLA